jgi:uncharacterized protein
MNGPRHRAWQFALRHPGDAEGVGGLRLTLAGGPAMVEADASVRQSLLLLLSTTPGERVMRPSYGCHLQGLVFSSNDDTTAGLAMHFVRQAVERWEPRVEILGLDAGRGVPPMDELPAVGEGAGTSRGQVPATEGHLEIALEYRVRSTGRVGSITYTLGLYEGG